MIIDRAHRSQHVEPWLCFELTLARRGGEREPQPRAHNSGYSRRAELRVIIDRAHRTWGAATTVLALVSGLLYWIYTRSAPAGPRGGSVPGLTFGGAGTALIVFAALLGMRRKHPTWRVGRAAAWMKGHIWLGLLTVPLILFHAGFSLGGPLTSSLVILLFGVTLSGVVGLALQQFVPRMMTEQVPLETIYEEIPHVCEQLRDEADALIGAVCGDLGLVPESGAPPPASGESGAATHGKAQNSASTVVLNSGTAETQPQGPSRVSEPPAPAGVESTSPEQAPHHAPPRPPTPEEAAERKARHRAVKPAAVVEPVEGSGPLRDFYLSRVRPYLDPKGGRDRELSRKESARSLFESLRTLVPPSLVETATDLHEICEERRQLYIQTRYHLLLHGWLLVHAPLTMALLVLTALHAIWAIRY